VTRCEVHLALLAQNAIKSRTMTRELSDVAEIYKRTGILLLSTKHLLEKRRSYGIEVYYEKGLHQRQWRK
jgi:hypothetical protein